MLLIKPGNLKLQSPVGQTFPTDIFSSNIPFAVKEASTAYGVVLNGTLSVDSRQYEEGEYFIAEPGSEVHNVNGDYVVFIRHGYRGRQSFGGEIEPRPHHSHPDMPHIGYTDLISQRASEPVFQAIYMPRSSSIKLNTGTDALFGVVLYGHGRLCGMFPVKNMETLAEGTSFVLEPFEQAKCLTGDTHAVLVIFKAVPGPTISQS